MLKADVEFRYSCEGRSERLEEGLLGLRERCILSVDKTTNGEDGHRYGAAMCA